MSTEENKHEKGRIMWPKCYPVVSIFNPPGNNAVIRNYKSLSDVKTSTTQMNPFTTKYENSD